MGIIPDYLQAEKPFSKRFHENCLSTSADMEYKTKVKNLPLC